MVGVLLCWWHRLPTLTIQCGCGHYSAAVLVSSPCALACLIVIPSFPPLFLSFYLWCLYIQSPFAIICCVPDSFFFLVTLTIIAEIPRSTSNRCSSLALQNGLAQLVATRRRAKKKRASYCTALVILCFFLTQHRSLHASAAIDQCFLLSALLCVCLDYAASISTGDPQRSVSLTHSLTMFTRNINKPAVYFAIQKEYQIIPSLTCY